MTATHRQQNRKKAMREIVFDTETQASSQATAIASWKSAVSSWWIISPPAAPCNSISTPNATFPSNPSGCMASVDEFLADKPLFAHVVEEFLDFLGDAPLVIHNASFDIKFINAELKRIGHAPIPLARAIDTIEIAKRKIPGARYSLDELCKRFGVDLSARTKHGALLDAQLTAQIYLELIGGRQRGLMLAPVEIAAQQAAESGPRRAPAARETGAAGSPRRNLPPIRPSSPRNWATKLSGTSSGLGLAGGGRPPPGPRLLW